MHHGRMFSSQSRYTRLQRSGVIRRRPSRHGRHGRLGELVHAHEPLQRDERLDPLARAVRERDGVRVGLLPAEKAELPQVSDDALARLERRQPDVRRRRGVGDAPVLADDRDLLEVVGPADLEVVGVVAGRDLQRPGANSGLT
jgi:hypothetical protein